VKETGNTRNRRHTFHPWWPAMVAWRTSKHCRKKKAFAALNTDQRRVAILRRSAAGGSFPEPRLRIFLSPAL
jgi:hypothetical protein